MLSIISEKMEVTTMKGNLRKFIKWVKKHKTALIIAGISITAIIFIAMYNKDSINELWNYLRRRINEQPEVVKEATNNIKNTVKTVTNTNEVKNYTNAKVSEDIINKRLTPRELGREVLASAQEINKRLCKHGFQEKIYADGYTLTESGAQRGTPVDKTTRYNHPFTNIVWDEDILKDIYTDAELEEIAVKKKEIQEALGDFFEHETSTVH